MKRMTALILCAFLLLSLAACGDSNKKAESTPPASSESASAADDSGTPNKDASTESGDLVPAQSDTKLTDEELYERWGHYLVGYWNAAEGRFALLDMEDNHSAVFAEGFWETEGGRGFGKVRSLEATGEQELTASVTWAATEATELNNAQKELTLTVIFDYSDLEQDGKIRIKIGDNDWRQYMFAGNTQEEAYQTYLQNEHG